MGVLFRNGYVNSCVVQVRETDTIFQSWGFSDFLSYLEPLRRLIFGECFQWGPTSDERLTSDEDFDFEGDALEESSTSSQREQQVRSS